MNERHLSVIVSFVLQKKTAVNGVRRVWGVKNAKRAEPCKV